MVNRFLARLALSVAFAALMVGASEAATLYISEFAAPVSQVGTVTAQMLPQPAITDQTVAIGSSSAPSAAFNAQTHAVMLECDAICSIVFGATPVATATNMRLPAGTIVQFTVVPGQKVAVITNT
jgi:hypothetical protein